MSTSTANIPKAGESGARASDDLLELARATGLRQHMHGVNATDARLILKRFVGALHLLRELPPELAGISDTAAEGGGFWRSCSGCHELNEGHDTGPYSKVFSCALGSGCNECGGIGAVWDSTDYDEMARSMSNAEAPMVSATAPFQTRVQPWMLECFGPKIAADQVERNHRFFEEATELVQSLGMTASEAHQLVDYTFNRPQGAPTQEVGGVMVTLAALCLAAGIEMHDAGEVELTRIWSKVEHIRAKQAAKPKHSPLPEAPTPPTTSADDAERMDALEAFKGKNQWVVAKGIDSFTVYLKPRHHATRRTLREAIDAAIAASKETT